MPKAILLYDLETERDAYDRMVNGEHEAIDRGLVITEMKEWLRSEIKHSPDWTQDQLKALETARDKLFDLCVERDVDDM